MTEIEQLKQGFETLLTKLLIAKSEEERNEVLAYLLKVKAAEATLLFLTDKIREGQSVFSNKAIELYYDTHSEEDLDEFKETLTFSANEIFGWFSRSTNIFVTLSLLEKIERTVCIAHLQAVKDRHEKEKWSPLTGLGLFEVDPQGALATNNQASCTPTDNNNIPNQSVPLSLTSEKKTPKSLLNSGLNTPAGGKYNSFADLFKNPDELAKCIKILREYRPNKPVINERNAWVSNDGDGGKAILITWIDCLKYCQKITKDIDNKQLAHLLEQYFPGLKFGSYLRYFNNNMDNGIKSRFEKLILTLQP